MHLNSKKAYIDKFFPWADIYEFYSSIGLNLVRKGTRRIKNIPFYLRIQATKHS